MSRDRMTGKVRESSEVLAKIQALEKQLIACDDAEIAQHADEIAKEEKTIVQKSAPSVPLKDDGDQNAKANKNWPLTDAERQTVASTLIKLANTLLEK